MVWDYHVIAVERDGDTSVIYDLTRRVEQADNAASLILSPPGHNYGKA